MKVRDIVTTTDDLQIVFKLGEAHFTGHQLVIPKGSRVQIYDIFQDEVKIQQLESPFLETWVEKSKLESNIE